MPRVQKLSTAALSIVLDDHCESYLPGDTISGRVQRFAPIVTANAEVKIALFGRASTEWIQSKPYSPGYHPPGYSQQFPKSAADRGYYSLINDYDHSHVLYKGPLHIPEDGTAQEWPFSFTIPIHPAPPPASENPWVGTFLPASPLCEASPILPMSLQHTSPSMKIEGLVEYYLEAELKLPSDTGKGREGIKSTVPFFLRNFSLEPPVTDFQLNRDSFDRQTKSRRLVPDMSRRHSSASQKVKTLFSAPPVPNLAYRVEVDAPQVIQLENTNFTPFRVRVVPRWDETSVILRDVPQTVKLTHLSLAITGDLVGRSDPNIVTLQLDRSLALLEQPLEIPFVEDSEAPYDVGTAAKLTFGIQGLVTLGQTSFSGKLCPTFTAPGVQIRHRLTYILRGEIAGERFEVEPNRPLPIKVLLPSDPGPNRRRSQGTQAQDTSWIRPPDDYELEHPPPSFAEVQRMGSLGSRDDLRMYSS